MSFDWGSFTGGIVGVIGVYGVFLLQKREDRKRLEPEIRRKTYLLRDAINDGLIGLARIVLSKDMELQWIADSVVQVMGHFERARMINSELSLEEYTNFLNDIGGELGSISVQYYKEDDDEMAKVFLLASISKLFVDYNQRSLQLKN